MNLNGQNKLSPTAQATELPAPRRRKRALTVREMAIFPMLAALMFCSKLLLEWAPNIHLLALFIITFTRIYRAKALIPIYLFVLLTGVYGGFNVWWLPYLYIWLPLWGIAMLLPKSMSGWVAFFVYILLGALHGMAYGMLYAPAQALFFGMNFRMTLAWILSGLPFDVLHAAGNAAACTLALPLIRLISRLEKRPVK